MPLISQPIQRFNLSQASILLLEPSVAEADIYSGMLFGFGGKVQHRCQTQEEAWAVLRRQEFDLIVVDAKLGPEDGDGYDFVRKLRHLKGAAAFLPVVMITGHTPSTQVSWARDSGVHYVVRKPVSPGVLLERILWIAREARAFIEAESYAGPDRRFQRLGPPGGTGRRSDDLPAEVGEAMAPNLDQEEVDQLFVRPRSGT